MVDDSMHAMVRMLDEIDRHFRHASLHTGLQRLDGAVRRAMEAVPREEFVPAAERAAAYGDHALPIGHEQTISQPFIVALMTQLLQPQPGDRVLEIGTGSGYQAAVLASLVAHVYSVEIVEPLARQARDRLQRLGIDNVTVVASNGALGMVEAAPFDKIIVTAAAPEVPQALVDQLCTGGLLVAPLGEWGYGQQLSVLRKTADGQLQGDDVLPVSFVPFTGR